MSFILPLRHSSQVVKELILFTLNITIAQLRVKIALRCSGIHSFRSSPKKSYREKELHLSNNQVWQPNAHITCCTCGIVYYMECLFGAFYIGKTIHQFQKRLYDHLYQIENGKPDTPVSRYVWLYYQFDTSVISLYTLEHISNNPRGRELGTRLFFSIRRAG